MNNIHDELQFQKYLQEKYPNLHRPVYYDDPDHPFTEFYVFNHILLHEYNNYITKFSVINNKQMYSKKFLEKVTEDERKKLINIMNTSSKISNTRENITFEKEKTAQLTEKRKIACAKEKAAREKTIHEKEKTARVKEKTAQLIEKRKILELELKIKESGKDN